MMIPALKSVIRRIDVAGKQIEVTLPPGLKEIYEDA
jgi:ribosomal 30S subunit maturation factor RimM